MGGALRHSTRNHIPAPRVRVQNVLRQQTTPLWLGESPRGSLGNYHTTLFESFVPSNWPRIPLHSDNGIERHSANRVGVPGLRIPLMRREIHPPGPRYLSRTRLAVKLAWESFPAKAKMRGHSGTQKSLFHPSQLGGLHSTSLSPLAAITQRPI